MRRRPVDFRSLGSMAEAGGSKKGYKVVLVGELGVGKSSVFMRFRDDIFHENYDGTRGMDHATKLIETGKEKVSVS